MICIGDKVIREDGTYKGIVKDIIGNKIIIQSVDDDWNLQENDLFQGNINDYIKIGE